MPINIIVAKCRNNGIGYNNNLPWKLKNDMKNFKELTIGNGNNAVIMGKKTYESLKIKNLPNRDNLILSTTLNINIINNNNNNNNITKTFNNIDLLEKFVFKKNYTDIWIIGGEKIYNYFINEYNNSILNIDNIYITYIEKEYICDTYFPSLNTDKYIFVSKYIMESITLEDTIENSIENSIENTINKKYNIYNILYKSNKFYKS
jgi:dihydrofolate reductase